MFINYTILSIRRSNKEMVGWHIQYLKDEDLWYLTNHDPEDGITFEGWYYTSAQLLDDLTKYINNKSIFTLQ